MVHHQGYRAAPATKPAIQTLRNGIRLFNVLPSSRTQLEAGDGEKQGLNIHTTGPDDLHWPGAAGNLERLLSPSASIIET